jgi:nucleoside-diphosphate-sugar epimerase
VRVLVVGAAGFLGRHVLAEVIAQGFGAVALDRQRLMPAVLDARATPPEWHVGDMATYDMDRIRGPIDAVVCAAASLRMGPSTEDWRDVVDTNVLAFARLYRWSVDRSVRSFIFTSSAGSYRRPAGSLPIDERASVDPKSAYHLSKLLAERLVLAPDAPTGLCRWALRLSSPYGAGQTQTSVLPRFVAAARAGIDLTCFGRGDRSQDFIDVRDAAWAHVACLTAEPMQDPGPINIGSGTETSMRALASAVLQAFGRPGQSVLFGPPDGSDGDRFSLDISLARRILGFRPRGLEEGLRDWRNSIG